MTAAAIDPAMPTHRPSHPAVRDVGRVALAVALLAAIGTMAVAADATRALEATIARPVVGLVTGGHAVAVGDRIYFHLGTSGPPLGVRISPMCSASLLLVPLLLLAASLLLSGRFAVGATFRGVLLASALTVAVNTARLGFIAFARQAWGTGGFAIAHHLVGALLAIAGFAAGVLVLLRAASRPEPHR